MLVSCGNCGIEFDKKPVHIQENERLGYRHFCSPLCAYRARVRGNWHSCRQCGVQVYRTPSQIKRTKSGNVFCSRSCSAIHSNGFRTGDSHPNYIDGHASYRDRALRTFGAKCQLCDYSIEAVLEVHHRDSDRSNNALENLIVLCPTHHAEADLGLITFGE